MDQERTAQQSAPPEELAHLDRILDMVNQELEEAQRTVEKMDEEYREAQQYLADRRGEDNARDMFQSQQMLSQIDAQGVSVVAHRDRLQKTKASPYFARIDFRSQEEGGKRSLLHWAVRLPVPAAAICHRLALSRGQHVL